MASAAPNSSGPRNQRRREEVGGVDQPGEPGRLGRAGRPSSPTLHCVKWGACLTVHILLLLFFYFCYLDVWAPFGKWRIGVGLEGLVSDSGRDSGGVVGLTMC